MLEHTTHDDDEYLTPEAVATLIGRSVAWVWRAARDGRLRTVRVVGRTRFRRREVESLLLPVER